VYFAFYSSKKKAMYFNEIRDKVKMSISSLQNAIKRMEKSKEISSLREKANIFYNLKDKESIALNFSKFDIQKFNNLDFNVTLPLKDFINKISNVAFILLFGSASREEEKKGSDIDLLIVTYNFSEEINKIYNKKIKEEIEEIRKSVHSIYHLSTVFVNEKEFKDRKDYLLEQAKETGFCIYNQQYYHKEILKDET